MKFRTELPKAEVVFKGDVFTLARLKINRRLSDETNCFTADLRRNGKFLAYASNRGCGGCNDLSFVDNEYIKTLTYEEKHDLCENVVTDLVELTDTLDYIKKNQSKGLVLKKDIPIAGTDFTTPEYSLATCRIGRRRVSIEETTSTLEGRQWLLRLAKQYAVQGYEIVNTNLGCLTDLMDGDMS